MFRLLKVLKSNLKATYKISNKVLKLTSKLDLSESEHLIIVSIPAYQQIRV
jgi:hypothetical protein